MIAQLTGRIETLEDGRCVIDVAGVGYLVHASSRTLSALPQAPAIAKILVETKSFNGSINFIFQHGRKARAEAGHGYLGLRVVQPSLTPASEQATGAGCGSLWAG